MKIGDALKVVEDRIARIPDGTFLPADELLMLDIARSLREQIEISKAGLEWSKGLAHLLETSQ